MSVSQIIQLVCLGVPLLISLIGFIISTIKALRAGKFQQLVAAVKGYVTDAEGFLDFTGEQKKNYVLSAAEDFCKQINFKFDKGLICKIIEGIIEISKTVNAKSIEMVEEKTEDKVQISLKDDK